MTVWPGGEGGGGEGEGGGGDGDGGGGEGDGGGGDGDGGGGGFGDGGGGGFGDGGGGDLRSHQKWSPFDSHLALECFGWQWSSCWHMHKPLGQVLQPALQLPVAFFPPLDALPLPKRRC